MKISHFVIGFLIIAAVTVAFAFLISDMDKNYTTVDINETDLEAYNKLDDINDLAADMNESLTNIQQGSTTDIIGGLLTSGFTVTRTTWASFGLYTDISSEAVDNANMGEAAPTFKTVALLLGILLFIFAMVAILINRDI